MKVDTHPVTAEEKKVATRRVTQKEYEKLAAFRFNLRQFMRFSEVAARSVGLTSQQHQALLSIKGFPDGKVITIGQLAEQLQVAHHTGRSFDASGFRLPGSQYRGSTTCPPKTYRSRSGNS
jgi:O6-methylguanine-DNA--protein-cysteine methyltransferase